MLEVIIGLGIVAWLFLYLIIHMDNEEHFFAKLMLFVFFLITLFLIPKAAIDTRQNCQTVIANITASPPTDIYEYKEVCFPRTTTTETTFLKVVTWFWKFIAVYVVVFVLWWFARKSDKFTRALGRLKSWRA